MPWSITKDEISEPIDQRLYTAVTILEDNETGKKIELTRNKIMNDLSGQAAHEAEAKYLTTVKLIDPNFDKDEDEKLDLILQRIFNFGTQMDQDDAGKIIRYFSFIPQVFLETQLALVYRYLTEQFALPNDLMELLKLRAPHRNETPDETAFFATLTSDEGLSSVTFSALLQRAIRLDMAQLENFKNFSHSNSGCPSNPGFAAYSLGLACLKKGLKNEAAETFEAILEYGRVEDMGHSYYDSIVATTLSELYHSKEYQVQYALEQDNIDIQEPNREELHEQIHSQFKLLKSGAHPSLFFKTLVKYAGLDFWDFSELDFKEDGVGQLLIKLADTCYQLKQENNLLKSKETPNRPPLLLSPAAKASASASSSAPASTIPIQNPLKIEAADKVEPASEAVTNSYSLS